MIDLHVHTIYSDGEKTPKEIIDMAIEKNIDVIAITDHDTIDGIEEALNYSKNKSIKVIPGIEISVDVEKGQLHMLGLNIDYKSKKLITKLNELKIARDKRNDKFIDILNNMGFEVTLEELKEISGGKIISKPHFAKLFIKKGYIKEKSEMFDNYFNQEPLKSIKKEFISAKEAIELIKNANGIPVLAHPQSLKLEEDELINKIKELKEFGLLGLECYHSNQTSEQMKLFKTIAETRGLLITKGSDYHGPIVKPDISIGTGINNNIVNDYEKEIIKNLIN